MSLITLKSVNSEPAYNFQNYFREAITFTKQTTLQLVSMLVNLGDATFNIVSGVNDTFIFRLGETQRFFLKNIVIPEGTYTGGKLAQLIADEMKRQNLVNGFTFNTGWDSDKKQFVVGWENSNVPDATGNEWTIPTWLNSRNITFTDDVNSKVMKPNTNAADSATDYKSGCIATHPYFSNGGTTIVDIPPAASGDGYGSVLVGFSRGVMAYPEQYGYDPVAQPHSAIRLFAATPVVDTYMEIKADLALGTPNTGTKIRVVQLTQVQGTNFPNAGWLQMKTRRGPQDISTLNGWGGFTHGTDHLQLKFTITNNYTMTFEIAHDTAGDGNYINNVIFNASGGSWRSTIKETFYPLVPVIMMGGSNTTNPSPDIKVSGIYFEDDAVDLSTGVGLTQQHKDAVADDLQQTIDPVKEGEGKELHNTLHRNIQDSNTGSQTLDLAAPPADMKPAQYFQFGSVTDADFVGGGGTIPDSNKPPAGQINLPNIAGTLGMENVFFYPSKQDTERNLVSTNAPEGSNLVAPGMLVELPDFNIQSYNGETGDVMKTISVVPKEDPESGEDTKLITYESKYPIKIKCNMPSTQSINNIRVRVREENGKFAQFLATPTQLTLLKEDGDSDIQQVKALLERQQDMKSERILNDITRVGQEMPMMGMYQQDVAGNMVQS